MLPIYQVPGTVKGLEVLYFEDAEVEKIKSASSSYATMGPLSVLYFKDYNRFVLQINDWIYPLIRRIPIMSPSASPSHKETNSRSYILPTLNGFSFNLRINNIPNYQAISNFEAMLYHNSDFSISGAEKSLRKLEASPDAKLLRKPRMGVDDTGPREIISESFKIAKHEFKSALESIKSGTKYVTSRKHKVDLKNIKNKNFRKTAHSTFKKDFFPSHEKLSQEFWNLRKNNPNLTQSKEFNELLKPHESHLPALFLPKLELEETIINNKELAEKGHYAEGRIEEKKGLLQSIKTGFTDFADSISGRKQETRERTREPATGQTDPNNLVGFENMTHYSG